jgi:hypothetical protein
MKRLLFGACCVALISAFASGLGAQGISADPGRGPAGDPVLIESTRQAECSLIDFEGLLDNQPIGAVAGTPTTTFGVSWLSLIDSDAGGTGQFANEPSPDTVAYYLNTLDPVDFDIPVQYVEVYYVGSAISLPVTLTAWDGPGGTGNVVDTALGSTVGTSFDGAPCTGDPDGGFCLWTPLVIQSATPNIMSITFEGAVANQFGFDNMTFCTEIPALGACCQGDGGCLETTELNCQSIGGTYQGDGSVCLGDGNGNGTDDACEVVPVPAFELRSTVLLGILVLIIGGLFIARMRR